MNHCYSLIWDSVRSCTVVASELVRRRGKGRGKRTRSIAIIGLLFTAATQAANLPTGGTVTLGNGKIVQLDKQQMQILQQSGKLALDWQSFDIGNGHGVEFKQPDSKSVAVNRVLGTDGSSIMGNLKANGQVYIINPNGVLFGKNTQVNVGSLVASTLDISNDNLEADKQLFTGSNQPASVRNEGSITAHNGGKIVLLGGNVSNSGTITAQQGNVTLAAGNTITLSDGLLGVQIDTATQNALVENHGRISADGGQVLLTAQAKDALLQTVVNNTGIIEANTLQQRNGRIILNGGDSGVVDVAGTINSRGMGKGDAGTVTLKGQQINSSARIYADSYAGKGGTVEINAADKLQLVGGIQANSYAASGGTVTTSGKQLEITDSIQVDTFGVNNQPGHWHIAADQLTVADRAVNQGSRVSSQLLSNNLWSTNIELASQQDLRVVDQIAWHSGNQLTLSSANNLLLDADISTTGYQGGLALNHGDDKDYHLANGKRVTLSGWDTRFSLNGDAYQVIQNIDQLQAIDNNLGGNYVLGNTIDASATHCWNSCAGFKPLADIGNDSGFHGVFSGLGNSIDNLKIATTLNTNRVNEFGLFSRSSGTLRDVALKNITLQAMQHNISDHGTLTIGGLVGYNSGIISDAHISGNITVTPKAEMNSHHTMNVGGLVGKNDNMISNASANIQINVDGAALESSNYEEKPIYIGGLIGYNEGNTSGHLSSSGAIDVSNILYTHHVNTGGLIGQNNYNNITNAFSSVNITLNNIESYYSYTGGLIGNNYYASLYDSHATGNINAYDADGNIGGLVGKQRYGTIANSDATGNIVGNYTNQNSKVSQSYSTAGLVGYAYNTSIDNSYATGNITMGPSKISNNDAGGLVGRSSGTTINNSYATGNIMNEGIAGGLVGNSYGTSSIYNSYAKGNVTGSYGAGGLVGNHQSGTSIIDSFATGDVFALKGGWGSYIGGLVGRLDGGRIEGSYATGNVTGEVGSYAGGLIGFVFYGNIIDSYAEGNVSGSSVGGLIGRIHGGTERGKIIVVENSYATGNVKGIYDNRPFDEDNNVGGLIGSTSASFYPFQNQITINNSHFIGDIDATSMNTVGGLIGWGLDVTITNSSATGTIVADNTAHVGGLVGYQKRGGMINHSVSQMDITAKGGETAGGLIGYSDVNISNSSARGTISTDNVDYVGGLVGKLSGEKIDSSQSFVKINTTKENAAGTLIGLKEAGTLNRVLSFGTLNGKRDPKIGKELTQ